MESQLEEVQQKVLPTGRKSLKQAQAEAVSASLAPAVSIVADEEIEAVVDYSITGDDDQYADPHVDKVDLQEVDSFDGEDRVLKTADLIGWDEKRAQYKFITNSPSLLIRLTSARKNANGEDILTSLGARVLDIHDVKFRDGVCFIKNKHHVKLLLSHKSFGGNAANPSSNAEPLFWLDNYPVDEWNTIKRRMKFVTRDENEYEA